MSPFEIMGWKRKSPKWQVVTDYSPHLPIYHVSEYRTSNTVPTAKLHPQQENARGRERLEADESKYPWLVPSNWCPGVIHHGKVLDSFLS